MGNRVYFCYSSKCPVSQMLFTQLVDLFRVETRTNIGTAFNKVDLYHVDMSNIGEVMTDQLEKLVSESEVFVLLWSTYCYEEKKVGDSERKIRKNILTELKALGKNYHNIYVLPVYVGTTSNADLINSIKEGIKENNRNEKYNINELIDRLETSLADAIRLEIKGESYTQKRFLEDSLILYYRILDCLLIPFKVPKGFKSFYELRQRPFLNDLFQKYNGGIYYEIRNTEADYAKILLNGLACAQRSFFATLRNFWLKEALKDENLARPNFEYLQNVESRINSFVKLKSNYKNSKLNKKKIKSSSYDAVRLMIGDGNQTVKQYFQGSPKKMIKKFIDLHQSVKLFYINEENLSKILKDKTAIRVPDFSVLDDTLAVMSSPIDEHDQSYGIVQTFLLNEHRDNKLVYDLLKEITSNPQKFQPRGLMTINNINKQLGL